jgi:S1-C subfamily serine protease
VVTSFDGKVVQNFDDLTAEIAKFRPGEKATLEIVRDTEKMTKEVTFGKWGAVQ